MMLVGLTGGIAAGKTTAADIFADLGVQLIDTDVIAHELLVSTTLVGKAIVRKYGSELIQADGSIDRALLRKKVTAAKELPWLERLLHPYVREEALAAIEPSDFGYAILVVPLLFETKFAELVDIILVVDIEDEIQWDRAMARSGMKEPELRALLQRQCSRQERLDRADMILDGSLDLIAFRERIIALDKLYRKQATHMASL